MRLSLGSATCLLLGGCAAGIMPAVPQDYSFPVSEILLHSVCELRHAFHELQVKHPKFPADKWVFGISLNPKAEKEWSVSLGLTGKSQVPPANFFNSWALGPGVQADVKGHRDGSASYTVKSAQLLEDVKYPLECDTVSENYHVLSQHLGIQAWLETLVSATDVGGLSKLTQVDKPTFNSQIVIVWNTSGSFTYNFPLGTDVASATGKYTQDETLTILITKATAETIKVQTLPVGGNFHNGKISAATTTTIDSAQQRLDQMQLEEILRNLQVSPAQ